MCKQQICLFIIYTCVHLYLLSTVVIFYMFEKKTQRCLHTCWTMMCLKNSPSRSVRSVTLHGEIVAGPDMLPLSEVSIGRVIETSKVSFTDRHYLVQAAEFCRGLSCVIQQDLRTSHWKQIVYLKC